AGSAHEDGGNSSRDGTDSGHARGGKGRRDGRYRRGGVGSADDVRNGDDGRGKDLDAQDVRFLVERKKLRDTLLAVEDLHFNEISLTRQVELMKGLSTVHFSAGQIIYREGDLSDSLYFMLGPIAESEAEGHNNEGCHLTTETKGKEGR
ncbi:unnamed protein product, partial [Pylaiella littoralis]